jgi:glycerol-3-phosphate O-acyltransferase
MEEQLQLYPHILPDLEDWPIYKLSLQRRNFIEEIIQQTISRLEEKNQGDFSEILAKTIYQERIRMREKPWRVDPPNEAAFWKKLRARLEDASQTHNAEIVQQAQKEVLYKIIDRYAEEIVGSFVPKTFLQARKILTALFKRLLSKRGKKTQSWGKKDQLYHRIKTYGDLEQIRNLARKGTIVIVPTHFSNLDSVLIGYAIDLKVGLPSFSYGAGLNLYNFGPAAYFMNRLGAYRVDRRKKNAVYLETLKSMSTLSIEKGTHSLFFPGGTRSRSGQVETRLKLGLLSTVIEAQRAICEKKINNKIFVVPLVLDYHFVLEARYLIEQHLREIGKEKYMEIKDFSKSKRKLLKFLIQYYNESSEIVMSFGKPFDTLGNFVDFDGNSYDKHGRAVEISDYFKLDGDISRNLQRESVYTKLLSDRIVERFHKDNMVLTSHLVAYTAFEILLKEQSQLDLFGVLKLPFEDFQVPMEDFETYCLGVRNKLYEMEARDEIKISEPVRWDIQTVIADGIAKLGIYHAKKPLKLSKDGCLTTENLKLLYYYHNRLLGYGLEREIHKSAARLLIAHS